MSTITREWLQQKIADMEARRDDPWLGLDKDESNTLTAMRIALASLEAKDKIPELRQVIYHFRDWNEGFPIERFKADYVISWMLANYPPAQPAAVSVPDDVSGPLAHAYKELTPTFMRNHIDVFERYGIYPDGSAGIQAMRIALDGMNRRAAMLQGAENVWSTTTIQTAPEQDSSPKIAESTSGNSPVIPDWQAQAEKMAELYGSSFVVFRNGESPQCSDPSKVIISFTNEGLGHGDTGNFREIVNSSTNNCRENTETSTKCWCHTCRPVKISDMRFVVCPECGNKRCPHANDHRNACTGSNEPGQEGSAHLAAPQQEVK